MGKSNVPIPEKAIQQWLSEGFIPFEPEFHKRPFGYHRRPANPEDKQILCPNCDAPNERSNFLRPDWQMGSQRRWADPEAAQYAAWLDTPEGKEAVRQDRSVIEFNGRSLPYDPSHYEAATCRRCGCETIIPGRYLSTISARKGSRPTWYYRPCEIPPKIEFDIQGQLDSPVWFVYWWKDGEIVKDPQTSDLSIRDMYEQNIFTINAHTGGVTFLHHHSINHWGKVGLISHTGERPVGNGLWRDHPHGLDEGTCNPLWNQWEVFIIEHAYIGNTLPEDLQVEKLRHGLSTALSHNVDVLSAAVEAYMQEYLQINPADMLKKVRFERERLRIAATKNQSTEIEINPDQMSLF